MYRLINMETNKEISFASFPKALKTMLQFDKEDPLVILVVDRETGEERIYPRYSFPDPD